MTKVSKRKISHQTLDLQVEGESLGIDTGMVDGEGQSRNWKPFWKHCGLCHPLFQPHFILHMDHIEEDKKVTAGGSATLSRMTFGFVVKNGHT